jgi:hypothetical protein
MIRLHWIPKARLPVAANLAKSGLQRAQKSGSSRSRFLTITST